MPPAIAKSFGQAAAATNPGAITFAAKKHKDGNNNKSEQHSPDDPNLVRVIEKGVEKKRPGVNDAITAPRLLSKLRITCELLANPLVLDS